MREQSGQARVLVIDDDLTILELIKAILMEDGHEVVTALSGDAVLNDGALPAPDLVVLDMFVPGISGAELAQALRARFGRDLPILVTSASSVDGEARALGAYECLPKPFELEELLAGVRQGLSLSGRAAAP